MMPFILNLNQCYEKDRLSLTHSCMQSGNIKLGNKLTISYTSSSAAGIVS